MNQTRPGWTRPAIPDHRLPRQAFILADGSFLYCCNSDRIVRSESGHRDNNRWGALLLRCFSFGLDDFIWPSIVDLNLVSDLGLLGLPHLGLQLCLLEFWPVSQRRLFWSVQCHINFTRGSVIRLRGAVGGLKRAGLSACREKSAESCMWLVLCGSDLPKSDSGTFLRPLLRLAGRMTLPTLPALAEEGWNQVCVRLSSPDTFTCKLS